MFTEAPISFWSGFGVIGWLQPPCCRIERGVEENHVEFVLMFGFLCEARYVNYFECGGAPSLADCRLIAWMPVVIVFRQANRPRAVVDCYHVATMSCGKNGEHPASRANIQDL